MQSVLKPFRYFDGIRIARRDAGGNVYYSFPNDLGSPTITTATGSLCYDADFYPFGGERAYTSTCAPNQKFAAMEQDSPTGLYRTIFRQYAANNGRWLSPDPYNGSYDLTNPQSMNRYSYVLNNTLAYVDPYGLYLVEDCFPGDWVCKCGAQDADNCNQFGGGGLPPGGGNKCVGTLSIPVTGVHGDFVGNIPMLRPRAAGCGGGNGPAPKPAPNNNRLMNWGKQTTEAHCVSLTSNPNSLGYCYMSCAGSSGSTDGYGGEYINMSSLEEACGPIKHCPSSIETVQTIFWLGPIGIPLPGEITGCDPTPIPRQP